MKVERAAVVGAGTMGAGIAQVLSAAGIEVLLKDVNQEFVDRGLANVKRMYDSRVKKGTLSQAEAEGLLAKVKGTTEYKEFADVDLVIEAALETIEVKKQIFSELDKICPPQAILASNTSALSISEIGACTKRPEKVLGLHFFNPAQFMKLVEVIPGVKTSKQTVDMALELCRQWQKVPVRVEECPGFLVNRLLFPYLNEAMYLLAEGQVTAEEVDRAAVEFGLPMGPFTLFDMTGIDVCAHVTEFLYKEYGPRFEPAPLLKLMIDKKFYGQKSGLGFFVHQKGAVPNKDAAKELNPELGKLLEEARKLKPNAKSIKKFDVYRLMMPMFNEAIYALQENVALAADIDVAMKFGCGLNRGLLSLAEEKGLAWCLAELESQQTSHAERFRPAWLLRKLVRAGLHDFKALTREEMALTR
ncbi:MAG: 3-hydroxyacyl-CoA dehydrogenase [Candidatus Obscuribacterales bacterium]|nr:3-hydroxyacyl-CoA dehydrogenase [Candidatus Obscuribacterales bacterium]